MFEYETTAILVNNTYDPFGSQLKIEIKNNRTK